MRKILIILLLSLYVIISLDCKADRLQAIKNNRTNIIYTNIIDVFNSSITDDTFSAGTSENEFFTVDNNFSLFTDYAFNQGATWQFIIKQINEKNIKVGKKIIFNNIEYSYENIYDYNFSIIGQIQLLIKK